MSKQTEKTDFSTTSTPVVTDEHIKQLRKLLSIIEGSSLEEVRLRIGDISISTRRSAPSVVSAPASFPAPAPTVAAAAATGTAEATPAVATNHIEIKSPMVGTFYTSPSPDEPTFVKVGDEITPGQVICVIEAMKLFNNIESEVAGKVVKVLVENATAVGYDHPLFLIEPI